MGICFGMVVTTPRFLSALLPTTRFGRMSEDGVPRIALAMSGVLAALLIAAGSLGELLVLSSLARRKRNHGARSLIERRPNVSLIWLTPRSDDQARPWIPASKG